ncbi:MAG: HAD family hydrolase [bacterium]
MKARRKKLIKAALFDFGDLIIVEIHDQKSMATWESYPIVKGMDKVVTELAKDYKLAVVSNTFTSTRETLDMILTKVGLRPYFLYITTSVDVGKRKPAPEIFLEALDVLGAKPHEAVMIGDRTETDIRGANALGIHSILFRWRDKYPDTSGDSPDDRPQFRAKRAEDLLRIFKRHFHPPGLHSAAPHSRA